MTQGAGAAGGTGAEVAGQVASAHRALAAAGQGDLVWGHLAVRDPGGRGIWMKAAGWGLEEITPARVLLVSPDGEVLAGDGRRHLECWIHTELARARPDVGATVHSHARAAVTFAALDEPLRALSHDGVPFADPDVARFTGTGDLIRTAELGAALAEALGDGNGCLIPGHGLITVGADPAAAVMHAMLLDRACRIQLDARAAGGPRRWSSPEEVAAKQRSVWNPTQLHAGYAYLLRLADTRYGPLPPG